VISRIATELLSEVKFMIRSLVLAFDIPTVMFAYYVSVFLNDSFPSSLSKKSISSRTSINRSQELSFAYMKSEILTKLKAMRNFIINSIYQYFEYEKLKSNQS
jgi:hypothetical protein